MRLSKKLLAEIMEKKERLIKESWELEDESYRICIGKVKDLDHILEKEREKWFFGIKPDNLIMVAGNLIGISMVLHYEKTDILTSRAAAFILKGKV